MTDADPIRRLALAFSRLPGIGKKTAHRLAFYVLTAEPMVAEELSSALVDARQRIQLCSRCCTFTDTDPCRLCTDTRRDESVICVVESVPTLHAIEATSEFRGRYHVLHGVLAPLDGVGPEQLRIKELLSRLKHPVEEVIVATNPSVEGEATAIYIKRLCQPLGIRVTRIASGVPMGSDLEYADQMTLARALEGRREL